MYFESILIKKQKPNTGFWRNKVVVFNTKTGAVRTVQPGMVWVAEDWEYLISEGFTHWIKPISKQKIKEQLCLQTHKAGQHQ